MSRGPEATIEAIAAADLGWFTPLERHAASRLSALVGGAGPRVELALALAARQVRLGHVCLDVGAPALGSGPMDEYGEALGDLAWPERDDWLTALAGSPLVACVPDGAPPSAMTQEPRPLALERPSGRLYLRRWWEHEAVLAEALSQRAAISIDHDERALAEGLSRLFPSVVGPAERGNRDQAHAAARVLGRGLTVITGGPGTGKTSAVVKVLALLAENAAAMGAPPVRVALLAPTGKAAARMKEAVTAALSRLEVSPEVRAAIPAEASTVHRALGARFDGTVRHDAENPLRADVVVVDEASMIDVALMRALVEAVKPDARLVILGDRDQLASVEAGAVLADLCGPVGEAGTDGTGGAAPMSDAITRLSYSFRFGSDTGIGALAGAVLAGDAEGALAVLADPAHPDVTWVAARPVDGRHRLHPVLAGLVKTGYVPYLEALPARGCDAEDAARALEALGRFRVLSGHRRGPIGARALGRAIGDELAAAHRIAPTFGHWHGRPIIITRNDYATMLFNGDVGVLAAEGGGERRLRAWFTDREGRPRDLSPARLPPHETVFAMSVHKSQGSEFDAVSVVLPEASSPLLTRELLYTAVTRARRSVTLFASEAALRAAIGRRISRASGLSDRLWGPGAGRPGASARS